MKQKSFLAGAAIFSMCAIVQPEVAQACGGFFCGQQPVDQTAERILFAVGEATTTMVVQIQYNGEAADFAWILPLADVPDPESLALFPQRALTALDANTGPQFRLPEDPACSVARAVPGAALDVGAEDSAPPGVTLHFEVEVGPYGAAVVESEDPQLLVTWLRDNDYRVLPVMEPYIRVYTGEGMKFLALKLLPEQDASDIQPLRFELPGQTPSIPIRLTALAAEPEMGVLVFILADQRYEGANWESVTIDDTQIRWTFDNFGFRPRTNWTALVAREIDAAGGRGWVTELAGSSGPYADLVRSQPFFQPEDEEAAEALLELLDVHPYLTRLYARLSPEEMTVDPIFRRSAGGDISNERQLYRYVEGDDLCDVPEGSFEPPPTDPCWFAACGAGGECYQAVPGGDGGADAERVEAACACVPGATARTTFDPEGQATVTCQDLRMSFLNPGDRGEGQEPLPDPCAGFDCGLGRCEAVNLTPTCVCDRGAVAVGSFTPEGERRTRCVTPTVPVSGGFYARRLPDLPADLPGGREVSVPPPEPGASGAAGASEETEAGSATPDGSSGGGCACELGARPMQRRGLGAGLFLLAVAAGLGLARRRGVPAWSRGTPS